MWGGVIYSKTSPLGGSGGVYLLFLWHAGNISLPMEVVVPVRPLRSSWTPYDVSTRKWTIFRSLAFRCSAISWVTCRYCVRHWRFFHSSSYRSHTLVVRNPMVGIISGIEQLLTNISFMTSLWNRMARSSIRRFPILFITKKCSDAGLTTGVVTS